MPVKGWCELDLHLRGIVCRTRAFVFEQLAEQMLLRANLLRELGLVIEAKIMATYPGEDKNYQPTQLRCSRVPSLTKELECACIRAMQATPSTPSRQTATSCSPPYLASEAMLKTSLWPDALRLRRKGGRK
eukprot:6194738-Pleurochrysis_carterae.AAC.1